MDHLVTRHSGAKEWLRKRGFDGEVVAHFDTTVVKFGDRVVGTLPMPMVADVCAAGAEYHHLAVVVPPSLRGTELSCEKMEELGTTLVQYRAERV